MSVGTPSISALLRQRQHEFAKQVSIHKIHRHAHAKHAEPKPKASRLGVIKRILQGDEGAIVKRKR